MTLALIIADSLIISLISFSGGIILVWRKLQTDRVMAHLVSFAAGVMLAVAFLDILPEALKGAATDFQPPLLAALLGVVLFFFLERFVLWFHHHDEPHGPKPSAVLILVGDGFHNFIDGVAIAATFMITPGLGLITTLAIAAHEIPQEIADLGVLLHGGMRPGRALWTNFISGLTALLGAVLGYFFLARLQSLLPLFLSFTAGMFIYIACSDLIPDLHTEFKEEKRWIHSIPFILGIGLLWVLLKRLEG